MKSIKIKTTVQNPMQDQYAGAFVSLTALSQVPMIQQSQNPNEAAHYQLQPAHTFEQVIATGYVATQMQTYKSKEMKDKGGRPFQLFTVEDKAVYPPVLVLSEEEKENFSMKMLDEKALAYFTEIFGKGNVEQV